MHDNNDVYLIFAGLGYPRIDEFLKEFPDRAFNFEASEQTCLDSAVGLAYSGKIPFIYTITPFFLRGWETIRTYINHEKLNVKMIGAGVNEEYALHDGFSHDASDIRGHFDLMKNIEQRYPESREALELILKSAVKQNIPEFINIHR